MKTSGRSSFRPAFWLLPPPERRALTDLHGFCRAADEAVDGDAGGGAAVARLVLWRAEVAALYGQGAPSTPAGRALAPHVARYGLAREDFERLLDALALDAARATIETEEDLRRYCEGVAASPGYLALHIFGCPQARPYAHHLGLALQLTNVLRDAREDLAAGRVYFPLEDLRRADVSAEELLREAAADRPAGAGARRLVELERQRARLWFEEAERAYRAQPVAVRRRLASARAMERVYRLLLAALERQDPLPRRRARPAGVRVLGALARSWLESALLLG